MNRYKERLYEILIEQPAGDRVASGVTIGILLLIAFNVIVSVAETEPSVSAEYPRFFFYFELFSVVVFTAEYLGRLWACTAGDDYNGPIRGRLKAASEPMAIIDFLAITPFYLQILVPGLDLRFVRALRLFRLFRVFKVGRYAESFLVLISVIKTRKEELAISTVIVLIMVVLSASAMWLCEHEAQPDNFRSVPQAMWWAIITITTIGYGDVTPVTTAGRIVGGIVAYLGICIFALPVGILGGAFIEEMGRQRDLKLAAKAAKESEERQESMEEHCSTGHESGAVVCCPHCGKGIGIQISAREASS
jgi:voltage-gated potassium channel